MKASVHGDAITPAEISVRDRKYGADPGELPSAPYKLELPISTIVMLFADYYDDYVEDAQKFGDGDDKMELALQKLNWPPFDTLAEAHADAFTAFLKEVSYDLLTQVFAANAPKNPRYFINSVDSVSLENSQALLEGAALDVG